MAAAPLTDLSDATHKVGGKVIAITGASGGIGEATARRLAAAGAKVVLGARRVDRLAAIAASIRSGGGVVETAGLDVTDRASMSAFVDLARTRFGRIDTLVNNAGIMLLAMMADLRTDEWDRMIDVNIRGVLNGIASALPHMQAQQSGHIVIVGSVAGQRVTPTNAVYAATKFAMRAIADGLRLEGGPIRSTLISPGAVQSELFDKIEHAGIRSAALSRFGDALPADAIARAIAYAIEQPDHVDVSEVTVRPMAQRS